jgi:drug/metabolite transporter (DMT)-like permease
MSDSPKNQSNFARGFPVAIVAAVILSTTALFIRYLTQTWQVPPLVLAFWRDLFVVAALFLILAAGFRRLFRVSHSQLVYLCGYGFILSLFNVTWTFSVARNGAAIATVLVNSSAAFAVVLGWLLLRERLTWVKIIAVGLAVLGCALVSGATDFGAWIASPAGFLIGAASGLCYALYSLMGRSASRRGLNPWTTVFYTFCFATVFLLGMNLLPAGIIPSSSGRVADLFWLGDSLAGWGVLLLLAIGPTLVGFGLINVSLSLLPSSITNLILSSEPAFTALGAFLLLGERMDAIQIAGGVLLLAGVVILRIYEGRSPEQSEALVEPARTHGGAV